MDPQNLDLNITETVWDHLDWKQNKWEPTSKEELSYNKEMPRKAIRIKQFLPHILYFHICLYKHV